MCVYTITHRGGHRRTKRRSRKRIHLQSQVHGKCTHTKKFYIIVSTSSLVKSSILTINYNPRRVRPTRQGKKKRVDSEGHCFQSVSLPRVPRSPTPTSREPPRTGSRSVVGPPKPSTVPSPVPLRVRLATASTPTRHGPRLFVYPLLTLLKEEISKNPFPNQKSLLTGRTSVP